MRLRRVAGSLPARLAAAYFQAQTPDYAAGLAFNAFLTMFPIVLGLFALLGLLVRDRSLYAHVEQVLLSTFPLDAQREVERTLAGARQHAATLAVLSIAGLVWAGTGLFGSLEFALNHVYGISGRNPFRQRLQGLRLVGLFVAGVVLAVGLNSIVTLVSLPILDVLSGWLVLGYMLWWIYRFVPNRRMGALEVLPGAVLASALVEVLTLAFPIFYSATHRSGVYTRGFALLFLIATWVYLLSQLVLVGALLNRLLAARHQSDPIC